MDVAALVLADVGERLGSTEDSIVEAGKYVTLSSRNYIFCR